MNDIVEKARIFATAAHASVGQLRKYTNEPYIVHPIEVVKILREVGATDSMLAAAYLHDVVEDTGVGIDLIEKEFGLTIVNMVRDLTDDFGHDYGNRATRKAAYRDQLANSSPSVHTIKIADIISNCSSIMKYDPNFAMTYIPECIDTLNVLKEGNKTLWERAMRSALLGNQLNSKRLIRRSGVLQ